MIYVLLAITLPLLGARGLDVFMEKLEDKETFKKALYVAGGIAGITIVLILIGESFFSFSGERDGRYNPGTLTKLQSVRIDLFHKGLLLAIGLSLGTLGLIWGLIHKKLKKAVFTNLLLSMVVLDLWIVNSEFMNVKPNKNMDMRFRKNAAIEIIENDSISLIENQVANGIPIRMALLYLLTSGRERKKKQD